MVAWYHSSQSHYWAQSVEIGFVLGSNISGVSGRPRELPSFLAFFRSLQRSTKSFYGYSTSTGATASASLNCGAQLRGLLHSMQMTSCSKAAWLGVVGRPASTSLADPSPKTIASACQHMSSSSRITGSPRAVTPAPIWSSLGHPGETACHGRPIQYQGRLGARTRAFVPIRRRKVRQIS